MGHTQSTVGLLLAVVGCGGAKDAETRAPDTETTDTETTDTETTDTETGCAVQVDLSGGIEPGCGAIDAPCGTITAGLMEAVAGCRVEVGAGTYSGATGETFPLVVGTGIEISGAGRSETVIDGMPKMRKA